jgi:hypothetical protein
MTKMGTKIILMLVIRFGMVIFISATHVHSEIRFFLITAQVQRSGVQGSRFLIHERQVQF